ncbi:MAG TPA: hypothetical protein VL832_03510 [Puia sp.]|nr:hypothetical protein [Puia sp.]
MSDVKGNGSHFKPMPPSEINRMVQNYKDTMTDDDTQSVWFTVSSLMALINDNQATGIRIHYGRHDKDHPSFPGRHNVILVATRDTVTPGNPCCETSPDLLDPDKDTNPGDGSFRGVGMDMGPMCPPRCVPPPPPTPAL